MMIQKKIVEIYGVPSDLGGNIRGASEGPYAMRRVGLKSKIEELGFTILDQGDLKVPSRESLDPSIIRDKFVVPIADMSRCLMNLTKESLDQGRFPLVLGGDHTTAIGAISGAAAHLAQQQKKLGLIWIDAHGDFNTPLSSETGNIHGMPLSVVLGKGHDLLVNLGPQKVRVRPSHVALIGVRMLDEQERFLVKSSGIHCFTMRDIDERGMPAVIDQALQSVLDGTDGLHISFDLDALDPIYAPGVSTPARGGMTLREARLLLEKVAESKKLLSMEMVELNPSMDICSETALLAVDLIQSALGKTII